MSDIWMNCSHCGHVFSTPDEWTGQSVACPQCKKQIAIFTSGVPSQRAPKLQVKHDSTITGGKRCPSCGSTIAPEAVICIRCGYDTRTGLRYLKNPQKSCMLQWVLWGFGLIILAGLTKTFLLQDRAGKGQGTIMPPAQEAPVAAASTTAAATNKIAATNEITATSKITTTSKTAAARSVTGIQTTVPSVAASINQSSAAIAKIDPDSNYRAALNRQLEATYPLYLPGDAVVLRRGNGLIHRGILVERKADAVVVVRNGQTNEIPLKVLDRASRLRCDPTFRARGVDARVQKRMKKPANF